jgi:RimJ/RimL family protein N-acetyltransferase
MTDAELLWRWRNDPDARSSSRNSAPIPFEEHLVWLEATLRSPSQRLYVANSGDDALGTARVDRLDTEIGEISITVAPEHRGQGIGRTLVELASARGANELGLRRVKAEIKAENQASHRTFAAAGYADLSERNGVLTLWWDAPGDGPCT